MRRTSVRKIMKKAAVTALCFVMLFALAVPFSAFAADEKKVVRVGWYESPFNTIDEHGRRSGYAYEYERKIAAYTGWTYEYVKGSWSELMQMLKQGEVDMMSDVSYKADRTEYMLYPSLPMGTEAYFIYVTPENTKITSGDYTSLNGKRVGVTKDSIQEQLFIEWAEKYNVDAQIVRFTTSEDQSLQRLRYGEIDAFVTTDTYGDPTVNVPVFKVGSSDFFFTVNKNRPDLLRELDSALSKIQDENIYYNEDLFEKYLKTASSSVYLTAEENEWLANHGTIKIGVQDNYLAFCAADPETGELTGALKDYLDYASNAIENIKIDFEAIVYPTASDAMVALKNGEVDCMFPANLSVYDSETLGVIMSPTIMRTKMDAVVRASEQKEFVVKDNVTVAVNEGNPNYDLFLIDNFPKWKTVHYVDTPACLDAIAAGDADCIIVSNYRYSDISKQCDKLHLTTVDTGVELDYGLAVCEGNRELYSVIAKAICAVPSSVANAALTYYSVENAKIGFIDYIMDNLLIIILAVATVILIILILILKNIRATKKVKEEEHLVNDLNRQVFVDALTSVRNKASFGDYIQRIQNRLDNGEALQFAIGVFDCNDLKMINDRNGHDKGDEYLKSSVRLICRVFQHSPVFRIGGDEFAVVLMNDDYECRDELIVRFEEEQKNKLEAENEWEHVSVAFGIAIYNPQTDHSVDDTFRRADKTMYENKKIQKESRAR